jgi:IS30 family transposase
MNLDDQIAKFLAEADARPARSKLEPCAELIRELRKRRWTFRKIADALREKFAVTASPSTIHDFLRVRAHQPHGRKPEAPTDSPAPKAKQAVDTPWRFHIET